MSNMNEKITRYAGDALLLVGLLLFVLGATAIVFEYRIGVHVAVVGALALIFVGAGASMKRNSRPPAI